MFTFVDYDYEHKMHFQLSPKYEIHLEYICPFVQKTKPRMELGVSLNSLDFLNDLLGSRERLSDLSKFALEI